MRIRSERLGRTGFVVTDLARPWRTLVVYRHTHPAAFAALREPKAGASQLELNMVGVTPAREAHLHGVIAQAWAARDARHSPAWAGRLPTA